MSIFRIYVDGEIFYHPNLSKLSITQAKVTEDAESIDSLVLSAPFNHPYLSVIKPMASTIVCKKGETVVDAIGLMADRYGWLNGADRTKLSMLSASSVTFACVMDSLERLG